MGTIYMQEIKEAIHMLQNNKTQWEDGICAEMLKAEERETQGSLHQEEILDNWRRESL